jgi:hypothetical protein
MLDLLPLEFKNQNGVNEATDPTSKIESNSTGHLQAEDDDSRIFFKTATNR